MKLIELEIFNIRGNLSSIIKTRWEEFCYLGP